MKDKRNVVLIGFMGSGKTTVGLRLSYKLRKTVIDTDKLIERTQGRAVKDIFATDGEEYFRALETKTLENLVTKAQNEIVSVGGGTPVREENRRLLREIGTVIYLRITADAVYERLKNDTTRPLLQGEDPKGKIEKLLGERESFYASCADIIVDVSGKDMDEVLEMIMARLEEMA